MLVLETKTGFAVPIQEFDKFQKMNLEEVKRNKREMVDMRKVSTYYPEIRFKNISRTNSDDSIDIVIDAGAANEIHTGFLPKRSYKALRIKKDKGIFGAKWDYVDMIQVSEKDIVSQFNQNLPISEIESILETITKKGVKYFD